MENEPKYLELVKLKIEYDTILSQVLEDDIEEVKLLLDKKHDIMKINGFFAETKINKINKKVAKYIEKAKKMQK